MLTGRWSAMTVGYSCQLWWQGKLSLWRADTPFVNFVYFKLFKPSSLTSTSPPAPGTKLPAFPNSANYCSQPQGRRVARPYPTGKKIPPIPQLASRSGYITLLILGHPGIAPHHPPSLKKPCINPVSCGAEVATSWDFPSP